MSPELQAKLDAGIITLCRVWRITRVDGTIVRLTDRDVPVTADGQTFSPSSGMRCSAIELHEGLDPTTCDISGMFDGGGISLVDYLAGLYSHADVEIGLADWQDAAEPIDWLTRGVMGDIKRNREGFEAQCNGISRLLSRGSAEVTSPTCRAQLGDARCKVNMTPHTYTGSVATVTSRRVFTAATALADGLLDYGRITFTSGANAGRSMEIKRQLGASIELYLPMPGNVLVADAFSATAGCDLLRTTCVSKFDNVANMRAEPDLPGTDRMAEPNQNFVE